MLKRARRRREDSPNYIRAYLHRDGSSGRYFRPSYTSDDVLIHSPRTATYRILDLCVDLAIGRGWTGDLRTAPQVFKLGHYLKIDLPPNLSGRWLVLHDGNGFTVAQESRRQEVTGAIQLAGGFFDERGGVDKLARCEPSVRACATTARPRACRRRHWSQPACGQSVRRR